MASATLATPAADASRPPHRLSAAQMGTVLALDLGTTTGWALRRATAASNPAPDLPAEPL